MIIAGLQKTTLLDYPSHVAATIFLGGCNFRCPFCHNMNIVDYNSLENRTNMKDLVNERDFYSKEDIFDFLKKRASVLEGICITGGEPTINSDLKEFIIEIREVVKQVSNADRFLIKLDTNGSNPKLLKSLIDDGLIDYVAMDIKSSREKYLATAGVTGEIIDNICESINILIHSNIEYEFRTTVVKQLHNETDMVGIGELIKGAKKHYLQSFIDSEYVTDHTFSSYEKEELEHFRDIIAQYVDEAYLRGVD